MPEQHSKSSERLECCFFYNLIREPPVLNHIRLCSRVTVVIVKRLEFMVKVREAGDNFALQT